MASTDWTEEELRDAVVPLRVIEQNIASRTAYRPTAMMLPLSMMPGVERVFNLPIVRGDRVALIYEAP